MSRPWLIDKSALARIGASPEAATWALRVERGLVHVATPTLLEIGYSALSPADWTSRVQEPPTSLMTMATSSPRSELRAVEVQEILARRGHHRAPSVPDLLIAAIAETQDLVVLHLDKDFELIAEVTGQSVERLRVG